MFAAVVVSLAVAVAGCGNGTKSSTRGAGSSTSATSPATTGAPTSAAPLPTGGATGAAGNGTACSLVSRSDAVAITGDSSITASPASRGGLCLYTPPEQPVGAGQGVVVLVEGPLPASSAVLQNGLRQAVKSSSDPVTAVSGIGDVAYSIVTHGGAAIAFAKGNRVVIISAASKTRSGTDMLASVESVAKSAAGHL